MQCRNIRVFPIVLGQTAAILNTATGIFSTLLIILGGNVPIFQLLWLYVLLAGIYGTLLAIKPRQLNKRNWYKFGIVAIADTQANFVTILAYQLTSIVSVLIIGNASVIMVMVLSILFLKRRYNKYQYYGTAVAFVGLVCIIVSHLEAAQWMWGGTVLGDFLVLTGAALYAISNILQELYMCEGADPSEYLMVLGVFGSIILIIQSYVLEYDNIIALNNANQYLCIVGFSICLMIDYAIAPYFFKNFGATFYNLSLLMSPLYSLFFDIFYSQGTYDALYLIGFCFVMVGILIYNIPVHPPKEDLLNSELSTLEEKEKIFKE